VTREELLNAMCTQGSDMTFEYLGVKCGVSCEVKDSKFYWESWCGNFVKEYAGGTSLETVFADPIFSEKSINELIGEVEFWLW